MQISLTLHGVSVPVSLNGNASSRQLLTMLPLTLEFEDFGSTEKIAYLPRKLTTLVRGPWPDPAIGDLCYYIPWGNLAVFHGHYESIADLVRLGHVEGDLAPFRRRGRVTGSIAVIPG